jgi:hypothetical protein
VFSSEDVLSIEFIPKICSRNATQRFEESLRKCLHLKSASAYCVRIPLSNKAESILIKKLSNEGFLCSDISEPTNIDWLHYLSKEGSNIYLHIARPVAERVPGELTTGMPDHLMHSKMILFEMEDYAEAWVGSHNWTRRAFDGPNIEISLILKIKKHSLIYYQCLDVLSHIKYQCYSFDPSLQDFYKLLQGKVDYFDVIQATTELSKNTIEGKIQNEAWIQKKEQNIKYIYVLSNSKKAKPTLNNIVYLKIRTFENDFIYLKCKINQTDNQRESIKTDSIFLVLQDNPDCIPVLIEVNDKNKINSVEYKVFINLSVEAVENIHLIPEKVPDLWIQDEKSQLLQEMGENKKIKVEEKIKNVQVMKPFNPRFSVNNNLIDNNQSLKNDHIINNFLIYKMIKDHDWNDLFSRLQRSCLFNKEM